MTREDSIKVRDFFTWVTSTNEVDSYFFAARPKYAFLPDDEWEVCMYGPVSESSSLVRLAQLASSLEWLRFKWSASVSSYNAPEVGIIHRVCVTIC